MKMFCTGSAGFIGSWLVDALISEGHEVCVYDNLSTGRRKDVNPKAHFIEGDVRDFELLKDVMIGQDMVWHLAANGDITLSARDTDFDFQANVVGTKNVLEAMRLRGIRQIAFSSTAAAYGDGASNYAPLAETFGPLLPISLYASSKIAGEAMISAYCHLFGMRAWIFRFANIVAGRMNHGVTHDLIKKLKSDPTQLEIWADGKGIKPYLHVTELLRGIMLAYRSERFKDCDIYNLGVTDFCSVDEVATIVMEEMGLDPNTVKRNYTGGARGFPGDVPVVLFNIEKANNLGWHPRYSSKEAVRMAAKALVTEITPAPLPDPPAEEPRLPGSSGPH